MLPRSSILPSVLPPRSSLLSLAAAAAAAAALLTVSELGVLSAPYVQYEQHPCQHTQRDQGVQERHHGASGRGTEEGGEAADATRLPTQD